MAGVFPGLTLDKIPMHTPSVPQIMDNIFDLPDKLWPEEIFETIANGPGVRIERILSCGQITPPNQWYDQETDEWVLLVQGSAVLRFESNRQIELKSGDHILIPKKCRHRVESTSTPCIWIAVHAHLKPGTTNPEPKVLS